MAMPEMATPAIGKVVRGIPGEQPQKEAQMLSSLPGDALEYQLPDLAGFITLPPTLRPACSTRVSGMPSLP